MAVDIPVKTRPEYKSWQGMKTRCYNPSDPQKWASYGGRGITVCDRWKNSFEHFLEDMGPRPEGGSLDRIDVNGNYCPENCRWATTTQQALNRRNSRILVIYGVSKTVTEWADIAGISRTIIFDRLRKGWADKPAVFTPKSIQYANRPE